MTKMCVIRNVIPLMKKKFRDWPLMSKAEQEVRIREEFRRCLGSHLSHDACQGCIMGIEDDRINVRWEHL